MFYEPHKRDKSILPHDPFKAIVAPRPIGWITSMSLKGEVNCAPYSYFNGVNSCPNLVMFASEGCKDSVSFIEETGEFVCNLATWDLREAMNATSAPLPRGANEMEHAGLEPAPSRLVKPPRVKAAPCALECKRLKIVTMNDFDGKPLDCHVVFGRPGRRRAYRRPLYRRWPARHRDHAANRPLRLRPICRGRKRVCDVATGELIQFCGI